MFNENLKHSTLENLIEQPSCVQPEKSQIQYYDSYQTYQDAMLANREKILNSIEEVDSKKKIIRLLELEYDELHNQQSALIYSNEEMLRIDPNDLELIECRAENMKFLKQNFERMKRILDELSHLDKDNKLLHCEYSLNFEKYYPMTDSQTDQKESLDNISDKKLLINNNENIISELEL